MSHKWQIEEFVAEDGESPIRTFILNLDERGRLEAQVLIQLLEARGHRLRAPLVISHSDGRFEIRGEHVCIFYEINSNHRITILDGYLTKSH